MKNTVGRIANRVWLFQKKVNKAMAVLDCGVILFLMLGTCYMVVARTFFGHHVRGLFEITEYCIMLIPFLGAPWLLEKNGHVSIDVIVNMLSPKIQGILAKISFILGALTSGVLLVYGTQITWMLFLSGTKAIKELAIPHWLLVLIIPISFFSLTLTFIRLLIMGFEPQDQDGDSSDFS